MLVLLIISIILEAAVAVIAALAARGGRNAAAGSDWGHHMAYLRQFGSDFFGRAGAEMRETYDAEMAKAKMAGQEPSEFLKFIELRYGHIPDFRDAKIPSSTKLLFSQELFEEWWEVVTAPEYAVKGSFIVNAQ